MVIMIATLEADNSVLKKKKDNTGLQFTHIDHQKTKKLKKKPNELRRKWISNKIVTQGRS